MEAGPATSAPTTQLTNGPIEGTIFVADHGVFPAGTAQYHLNMGHNVFDYLGEPVQRDPNIEVSINIPDPERLQYIFVYRHGIFPANTALYHLEMGRHVFNWRGDPLRVIRQRTDHGMQSIIAHDRRPHAGDVLKT